VQEQRGRRHRGVPPAQAAPTTGACLAPRARVRTAPGRGPRCARTAHPGFQTGRPARKRQSLLCAAQGRGRGAGRAGSTLDNNGLRAIPAAADKSQRRLVIARASGPGAAKQRRAHTLPAIGPSHKGGWSSILGMQRATMQRRDYRRGRNRPCRTSRKKYPKKKKTKKKRRSLRQRITQSAWREFSSVQGSIVDRPPGIPSFGGDHKILIGGKAPAQLRRLGQSLGRALW